MLECFCCLLFIQIRHTVFSAWVCLCWMPSSGPYTIFVVSCLMYTRFYVRIQHVVRDKNESLFFTDTIYGGEHTKSNSYSKPFELQSFFFFCHFIFPFDRSKYSYENEWVKRILMHQKPQVESTMLNVKWLCGIFDG